MKLIVVSDTHNKLITALPYGDVLIHCGDYSSFGSYEETKKFMNWFNSQPHKHKIVIPGNHEVGNCPLKNGPDFDRINKLIESYTDIHYLVDSGVEIDGMKFYGSPWCGGEKEVMWRWGWYIEEDEIRGSMFNQIPDDTDVLITHSPPYGILDKFMGRNLGCLELERIVKKKKPQVHVFGHIHGGNGQCKKDDINYFNCSNLTESYQLKYPCRVICFKDGKFSGTTTMLVSQLDEKKLESGWPGGPYPPIPEEIELPQPLNKGETEECIYCKVKINEENKAFTTMRGTMCMRCHWEIFD